MGAEPGEAAHAVPDRPRVRRGPVFWVKVGFGVLVVAFGILFVARHWPAVSAALAEMGWPAVLASVPLGAAGVLAGMLAWRALLADLGAPLRLRDAGHVFLLSQLGKYVPGSVWPILAQVELGRQLRVRREASLAATLLAVVLSVTCGLAVAAALLPLGGTSTLRQYRWAALAVPFLLALLHPALIVGVLGRLLRAVGRTPLQVRPTLPGIARAAGWQVLGWLLLGLHAYVLLLGLHVDAVRALPLAVGGFALAYCLGVLVIPAPAGAGIRDAALAVALSAAVSRPQAALAVALVSRFVMAFVDFGLAGAWSLGRSAGAAALPGTAEEMSR
jgi:glycosyltransferase 2 family protein